MAAPRGHRDQARGHAAELAFDAADAGVDVVLVLGGDGTVNEVVNGLLADGVDVGAPALAVVPGGSTNVFARAIGMPDDHVEATGLPARGAARRAASAASASGVPTSAGSPSPRDSGSTPTSSRRSSGSARRDAAPRTRSTSGPPCARWPDARHGQAHSPLQLADLEDPVDGATSALVLVGNTSPWTYLGRLPLDPFPGASFDLGLDLLALRAGAAGRHRAHRRSAGSPLDRGRPEGATSSTATTSPDSPSPRTNRSPSRSTVTTSAQRRAGHLGLGAEGPPGGRCEASGLATALTCGNVTHLTEPRTQVVAVLVLWYRSTI